MNRSAALTAVAAAFVLSACSARTTNNHPAPVPGVRVAALQPCPAPGPGATSVALPDLTLPCLGTVGAPVSLRALTGLPTVVNLWASWCGPCREELPALQRLADRTGSRLRVLGVDSSDEAPAAAIVVSDLRLRYPMVFDYKGTLLRGLIADGVSVRPALPVTALIRADGTLAKVYQGTALTDERLRILVRDALGVAS